MARWKKQARKSRKRKRAARKVVERADRRDIYLFVQDDSLGAMPASSISPDFAAEINHFAPEIKNVVSDRRLDGELDGRLVVFLDPLKGTFFTESEEHFEYSRGDFEVLGEEMAEHLVTLGACAFHPGPEKG